jgi:hypothetical protein
MVSLGHGKFSEKTLLRMEHLSGVGLLILALVHGGIIVSQMARHHLPHRPRLHRVRVCTMRNLAVMAWIMKAPVGRR